MKGNKMHNVIDALRHMAENGGFWYGVTHKCVWYLYLFDISSGSFENAGFTQQEMQEFLKHYEELTNEQSN